jgi:tetratricopeptide (TPR) repeat protein
MSETESTNSKVDWRDSLRRHAFEEALARQRALGLIGQSEGEVLTALEQLVDCQKAIRHGDYVAARKAVHPNWTQLEPTLASSTQAIEWIASAQAELYEQALELAHPLTLADAHNSLGKLAVSSDLEKSEDHFKRALEADPRHHRALTNLGNIELERGEVAQAIERYREAIKLSPDYATAHNNLAAALRRSGKLSESVAALKRSQRLTLKQESAATRDSTNVTSSVQSVLKSLQKPTTRYTLLAVVLFLIYRFLQR